MECFLVDFRASCNLILWFFCWKPYFQPTVILLSDWKDWRFFSWQNVWILFPWQPITNKSNLMNSNPQNPPLFSHTVTLNWLKLLLSLIPPESTKVAQQNSDPLNSDVIILLFETRNRRRVFSFVDTKSYNTWLFSEELRKTWTFVENRFRGRKIKWSFPLVENWAVIILSINQTNFQDFLIWQQWERDACASVYI